MGRKSKRKANAGAEETSRTDRKDILRLCGQIIDLAATQSPPTPAKQWEEFQQINNLVEKIRKKQHDGHLQEGKREAKFEAFLSWLHEHGVQTDDFKIVEFKEGCGLQATRDIKSDEELMCIPRKLMISDQNARDSSLGELIRGDRLLKGMPNVSLALFLISEKLNLSSFWKPYIDILPSSYTLPLYYTPDQLQLLQGSPVFSEALKQHKNIARQYAYLYKVLNQPDHSKLQLRDHFTYDLYRWAVSTVMSRQNQIPSKEGMGVSLTLIPLWDMCNHTNGEMKTDFDSERDACVNIALRDFSAGEQIYLCYGRRTNADLLLYSGFVDPDNDYDGMSIQLGLSSGDRLYAMKAQLCSVMRLAVPSQSYNLTCDADPVSLELLTFLRIFCMTEGELKERLLSEERRQLLFKLVYKNQVISKLNELRICVFLATRVTLLQQLYKTSIEEDEEKLKNDKLSFQERCITQLLLLEKRILENVLHHCALWREKAEDLPEGATSYTLPQKGEEEDTAENWEERDGEKDEEEKKKEEDKNEEEQGDEEERRPLLGEPQNEQRKKEGETCEQNGETERKEETKVNGVDVETNGLEIPPKVNGDTYHQVDKPDDKQGKIVSLNGDVNENVIKVNGGHHIENGNGNSTDGCLEKRTDSSSSEGLEKDKAGKANGHIAAAPTSELKEE